MKKSAALFLLAIACCAIAAATPTRPVLPRAPAGSMTILCSVDGQPVAVRVYVEAPGEWTVLWPAEPCKPVGLGT